jgi:hypothetical protein
MKVKLTHLQLLYVGFDDYELNGNSLLFKNKVDALYFTVVKKVANEAERLGLFKKVSISVVKQTDKYVFKTDVTIAPSVLILDYLNETTIGLLSIYPKNRLNEKELIDGLRYFSQLRREAAKYYKSDGSLFAELKTIDTGKDSKQQQGNDTGSPDKGSRHGLGLFDISIDFLNQVSDALLDALGIDPNKYRKWVYIVATGVAARQAIKAKTPVKQAFLGGTTALMAYLAFTENKEKNSIGKINLKSRFKPIFKTLPFPEMGWKAETNIKYAQNKAGVYLIKENGKLAYIGAGANVYKTALRHFEPHTSSGQRYSDNLENKEYTIRIVLTNTPKQAFNLETLLINKHKPRDNAYIPELPLKRSEAEILAEYESLGVWTKEMPF